MREQLQTAEVFVPNQFMPFRLNQSLLLRSLRDIHIMMAQHGKTMPGAGLKWAVKFIQRLLKKTHSAQTPHAATLFSTSLVLILKENIMNLKPFKQPFTTFLLGLAAGAVAVTAGPVLATMSGPKEHAGLSVDMLAELSEETMQATIGLEGYTMRMRAIEIAPGGQIAEHSHEDRPGIVTVIDGAWVEGQPAGENTFDAATLGTFPEREDTVHWVYNRSEVPATALVCDIAKVN